MLLTVFIVSLSFLVGLIVGYAIGMDEYIKRKHKL